ncbi:hypothetical protein TWF481_001887 [Arthrobotrys musiformis]|uniref:Uncharacterized protein n=1 Tax=Arthrobotrys musiformis TaxID=47236 RepID=A0AAV9VUL6_9PEZI
MKAPLAILGVSLASLYSHKVYKNQQEQRSKTELSLGELSEKQPHIEPEAPQKSSKPEHPWWNPPVRHEAKYAELMNVPWIR